MNKEEKIRTFDTGATRDNVQGKLDYVKALSPIVLRRFVQYLDKHRLQPDGSYRDFDNWKKGIPQETYHSSGARHFFATWLLTEGYDVEDNHGPVDLEDALCAEIFNKMGRLHEILKTRYSPMALKPPLQKEKAESEVTEELLKPDGYREVCKGCKEEDNCKVITNLNHKKSDGGKAND